MVLLTEKEESQLYHVMPPCKCLIAITGLSQGMRLNFHMVIHLSKRFHEGSQPVSTYHSSMKMVMASSSADAQ